MDTNDIRKHIQQEIPETRTETTLLESLRKSLVEVDRILMRLSEKSKEKRIVFELLIEDKN